jgi:hypothetical protein
MLTLGLLVAVDATFTSVLLVAVESVTFESVLLIAVGDAVLPVLFEVVDVGAALAQAAKAITLVATTMLKIVFRLIYFLHL